MRARSAQSGGAALQVASFIVLTNRTRISAAACLALTLGMVINVFGLQSAHRPPMSAIAEALPSSTATPVPPASSAKPPDLPGQLMSDAGPGMAAHTAVAGLPARDLPPAPDAALTSSIQRELADRGYAVGQVNGRAGLLTRSAIMAFEFDQHFPLTGEPGEELLRRILLGLAAPDDELAVPPGAKAARIIGGAQRLLRQLGYDPGPVNAQLGEPTRKALRRFEADAGLLPKGRISGEVMAELAHRSHTRIDAYDEALSR